MSSLTQEQKRAVMKSLIIANDEFTELKGNIEVDNGNELITTSLTSTEGAMNQLFETLRININ
jgi:hypothetical protein